MLAGFSLSQIASAKADGRKIGAIETVSRDMDIIRSRWLDKDPEWFHRARLARIQATEALKAQMVRLNTLILEILDGQYDTITKNTKDGIEQIETVEERPKKLVYAESQLTTIISKLYEIDADFDPEQYLDARIAEGMKHEFEAKTPKAC